WSSWTISSRVRSMNLILPVRRPKSVGRGALGTVLRLGLRAFYVNDLCILLLVTSFIRPSGLGLGIPSMPEYHQTASRRLSRARAPRRMRTHTEAGTRGGSDGGRGTGTDGRLQRQFREDRHRAGH